MWFRTPLQEITLDLVKGWVSETGADEGQVWDYKGHRPDFWLAPLPDSTQSERSVWKENKRREFLNDIVAFMNSDGGDLVYGVTNAGRVKGVDLGKQTPDITERTLRETVESWIEPVPQRDAIEIKTLEVGQGYVVIVRVRQSWRGPHQVSYQNQRSYPVRLGNKNSLMTHQQLLDAFVRRSSYEAKLADEFGAVPVNAGECGITIVNPDALMAENRVVRSQGDGWSVIAKMFSVATSPRSVLNGFEVRPQPPDEVALAGLRSSERVVARRYGTVAYRGPNRIGKEEDKRVFYPVAMVADIVKFFRVAGEWWSERDLAGQALIVLTLRTVGAGTRMKLYSVAGDICRHEDIEFEPFEFDGLRGWSPPESFDELPSGVRDVIGDLWNVFGLDLTKEKSEWLWREVLKRS